MKRLFIAIKIKPEPNLIKVYHDVKYHCQFSKVKWVDENLFHITLKFLGDTPEDKIKVVENAMEETVADFNSFSFDIQGVGVFGSYYRPRVIWFGLQKSDRLKALGSALVKELEKKGFENDRQNFVPHLTVGRIKYIQDKKRLQQVVDQYKNTYLQSVKVDRIILYESILKREGPQYFSLREVYLK